MLKFINGYQNAESFVFEGMDCYVTQNAMLRDFVISDHIYTQHIITEEIVEKQKCNGKRLKSAGVLASHCYLLQQQFEENGFTTKIVKDFNLLLRIGNNIIKIEFEKNHKWYNEYYELFLITAYLVNCNLIQDIMNGSIQLLPIFYCDFDGV